LLLDNIIKTPPAVLAIGLVGLDMSHALEFTRRLNDARDAEHVPGARVVAGWPGGSQDFPLSWSRVGKFTAEVRDKYGVAILDSPEAVAERVDLLLITAADGRVHRPLFDRLLKFRRPMFIEKPMTLCSRDAREMFQLAAEAHVPLMSCSTARFGEPLWRAIGEDLGKIIGCDVFGPMPEESTQTGLFWYGVHSIEVLNVVMGRGCRAVRAVRNDEVDIVVATWSDGRVATFRGLRSGEWKFGMTLHRERGVQFVDLIHNSWFKQTLDLMLANLPNGKTPVEAADTLEIIRIIEAANSSRASGRAVEVSGADS
jgi:predicted dehydrogenase